MKGWKEIIPDQGIEHFSMAIHWEPKSNLFIGLNLEVVGIVKTLSLVAASAITRA